MGGHRQMTTKTAVLLLLYARGPNKDREPVRGKTRMQKLVFLFEKEVYPRINTAEQAEMEFCFEALDYGPFSRNLSQELEALGLLNLVNTQELYFDPYMDNALSGDIVLEAEEDQEISPDLVTSESVDVGYEISDLGARYVEECMLPEVGESLELVSRLKLRVLLTPLASLLKYVYTKYPEYAGKSLIRGKVLG